MLKIIVKNFIQLSSLFQYFECFQYGFHFRPEIVREKNNNYNDDSQESHGDLASPSGLDQFKPCSTSAKGTSRIQAAGGFPFKACCACKPCCTSIHRVNKIDCNLMQSFHFSYCL